MYSISTAQTADPANQPPASSYSIVLVYWVETNPRLVAPILLSRGAGKHTSLPSLGPRSEPPSKLVQAPRNPREGSSYPTWSHFASHIQSTPHLHSIQMSTKATQHPHTPTEPSSGEWLHGYMWLHLSPDTDINRNRYIYLFIYGWSATLLYMRAFQSLGKAFSSLFLKIPSHYSPNI